MSEPITTGRRARNRTIRAELDEARLHGLGRRHIMKLRHLGLLGQRCRCGEQEDGAVHQHTCSYQEVVYILRSNENGVPRPERPAAPRASPQTLESERAGPRPAERE